MTAAWESKPLGDLCEVLDSRRQPVTKKNRRAGKYPYYGATGIVDYVDEFIFDEPLVLVGEDGAKWGSGEGTAFSVAGRCWVNNHAHVLRPVRKTIPIKKIPQTNAIFTNVQAAHLRAANDSSILRISIDAKASVKRLTPMLKPS